MPRKVNYHGIRRHTLEWIQSFTNHRLHQVVIDGHFSSETNVTSRHILEGVFLSSPLVNIHKRPPTIAGKAPSIAALPRRTSYTSESHLLMIVKDWNSLSFKPAYSPHHDVQCLDIYLPPAFFVMITSPHPHQCAGRLPSHS